MMHLVMAFAIAHPGVTSAIIGRRTMEQLEDLLAGADVTLTDEIVPPGADVGRPGMPYFDSLTETVRNIAGCFLGLVKLPP
jgi:aryl-alcohol dehydrogenase-like predicted oxidoreductase